MKRLRVEQRKGERADIFAMRAFAIALPHMDLPSLRAFARWIFDRASSDYEAQVRAATVDGLGCVEWIKKYRNDHGVPLMAAKGEWDKRVAALSAQ